MPGPSAPGPDCAGRVCTVVLVGASMVAALQAEALGGPLGIVVALAAAVMGPISIPLLLGLLPAFRRCGPRAALVSWACGLAGYLVVTYVIGSTDRTATVATPLLTSLVLFAGLGFLLPEPDAAAGEVTAAIGPGGDDRGPGRRPAPSSAPRAERRGPRPPVRTGAARGRLGLSGTRPRR